MASEVPWQDLEVEELKVTSAVLTAGAHYYGQFCKAQNDAFMECREYGKDPRKCLKEGKEVRNAIKKYLGNITKTISKIQPVFRSIP